MNRTSTAPKRTRVKSPEASWQAREPSNAEKCAGDSARERQAVRPARPAVSVTGESGGTLSITSPHADRVGWGAALKEVFGTSSEAHASLSMARIFTAVADKNKTVTETQANTALALMAAIEPRNELEAALGEQIVANHVASMDFLHRARLNAGEYRDTAVAYANAATKLTRNTCTLVEALAKLRNGGKQQVEVRYVYVDARGGQNIIASQLPVGGGASAGSADQPHVPGLPFAPGVSMWGPDASEGVLSSAGDGREAAMPAARRQESGCPEGEG